MPRKLKEQERAILESRTKPPPIPGHKKSTTRNVAIILGILACIPVGLVLLIALWPLIIVLGIVAVVGLVIYLLIFLALHVAVISATLVVNQNEETKTDEN